MNNNNVINIVNNIISEAIKQNASDIHFEPYSDEMRVRVRVDGLLYTVENISKKLTSAIIARLKVMAKLDIAEKRLPQDGQFSFRYDNVNMDLRINTCPFIHGEKAAIRLLESASNLICVNNLGMSKIQLKHFKNSINKTQGLILVTGPTGSGKTITLYSALNQLNQEYKNISSVEDPVEIQLDGINQIQVNPSIGLDFSKALRAFLRQDPDIIMVGEIRDKETAEIAIRASQTGHLVLSTLHTNSGVETITRLMNMGVKHYNLASSIELIVAQRLARKICTYCMGNSCQQCKNGYKGRIGIFEVLPVNGQIKNLILNHANTNELIEQAKKEKITMLDEAGLDLVKRNVTDEKEILRVLYT